MKIFNRLRTGWNLGIKSLEIIAKHPKLLLFPILSGLGMIAVLLTFATAVFGMAGFDMALLDAAFDKIESMGEVATISITFVYYLITYYVIVFFNVGLVHNARLIFAGEEPSVREGISFAAKRGHTIFAWAVLAATVGLILKMLEDRLGSLVSGIIGFGWTMATYFVVPTLAAEDIGPFEALKRSAATIKAKWGESIGAGFSFGLFNLIGFVIAILSGFLFGYLISPALGVGMGILAFFLTIIINSAARNIFLAAAYEHTQGNTPEDFGEEALDGMFMAK